MKCMFFVHRFKTGTCQYFSGTLRQEKERVFQSANTASRVGRVGGRRGA